MKGITWTQVVQYWVLITAFLIPAIAISFKLTGNPVPQVGMGSELVIEDGMPLLAKLDQIHADLGFASYTAGVRRASWNKLNVFCVTAGVDGRHRRPAPRDRALLHGQDRQGGALERFWALLFIAMLYLTAPATARSRATT